MITPTKQQESAIKETLKWYKSKSTQYIEISGIAGSGKTTIVYMLIETLGLKHDEVLFMSYTGKATLALARKGNFAKTIHSTIYNIELKPLIRDGNAVKNIHGNAIMVPEFRLKQELPPNIKLLVIDEAPMVPENMAKDILSFDIPIIALGDINQLPPVFGNPFFLREPNIRLTEPMRQALDSPIIYLAYKALNGEYISKGKYGDSCYVIPKDNVTDTMLTKSDIIICGKNSSRDYINDYIRTQINKIDKPYPIIGDKMICRQNNWSLQLDDTVYMINGLIGYVEDVDISTFDGKSISIDFRPEFEVEKMFKNVDIDYKHLVTPYDKRGNGRSYYNKFEYGYAITCHLAQGSEYDNILIYNEFMGDREYYKKWLYTAITRSKKGIILSI